MINPLHIIFCAQVVEKLDLIGLDFLWQICLNIPDPTIAESGIALLMNVSYSNLAPRLKKVRPYLSYYTNVIKNAYVKIVCKQNTLFYFRIWLVYTRNL